MARLIPPFVIFVVAVVAGLLMPAPWAMAGIVARSLAWLGGAWLLIRLLDVLFWHGLIERRSGHAPPRLLTDLLAAGIFIAAGLIISARELSVPVAGIITTSGVLVAVIGFALRDMLASLFAGIALNFERPYAIGDWIEVGPGQVGQVTEVSWLTTRLLTKETIRIIVPNAQLATLSFKNYGTKGELFRTQVEITLDHGLRAAKVERILLAAARAVADIATMGPGPDLKISNFDARGVTWLVRFWLDDYDRKQELTYTVQRSILQHIHQAGISLPYEKMDLYHAPMPDRFLDYAADRDKVLARSDLFRNMDPDEVKALAASAVERRFGSGDTVVSAGDETRTLFIVLEGLLQASIISDDGTERVVNRLTPGSMFGEFALLTGEPRSATVRTTSDVVLLEITETELAPVLRRCPDLAKELSRVLALRQAEIKRAGTNQPVSETGTKRDEAKFLARIRNLFSLKG